MKNKQTLEEGTEDKKFIERTRIKSESRKNTIRIKKLIESLNVAILLEDENRKIIFVNQAFCEMFGIEENSETLYGYDCSLASAETAKLFKDEKFFIRNIEKIIKDQKTVIGQELKLKDGRILERDYIPISIDKKSVGNLWKYTDITPRKKYEKDLIEAKEKAESATRAKSDFITLMSHEIRTPLNGVIGVTDLLANTNLNFVQQNYVETIKSSGEILLNVVNDILDFSKIEVGELDLNESLFDLKKCINDSLNFFEYSQQNKNLLFKSDIDELIPKILNGDPKRVKQLLFNLISNAVKFTAVGTVLLTAKMTSFSEDRVIISFCLKDTGIGISEENQKELFKPFHQVDRTSTRKFTGTGLGLFICKKITEQMSGEIFIESKEGEGTSFFFNLQFGYPGDQYQKSFEKQKSTSNLPKLSKETPLKILIAEDNRINQNLLIGLLNYLGYEPDSVKNGLQAVELADNSYDLILMDMQMPEVDGIEASKRIRSKNIKSKIVAITANALERDREKCLEAGMNDFLAKPINFEAIVLMIKKLFPKITEENNFDVFDPRILTKFAIELEESPENFISEHLKGFPEEFDAKYLDLTEAFAESRFDDIYFISHYLKGSCKSCGINKTGSLLEEIEILAKEKNQLKNKRLMEENISLLKTYFTEFLKKIKEMGYEIGNN